MLSDSKGIESLVARISLRCSGVSLFALQPPIVFSSVVVHTTTMEKIAIVWVVLTLLFVMREKKTGMKHYRAVGEVAFQSPWLRIVE